MSKQSKIEKAKNSKIFPQEYLESYERDLRESISEHEEKKNEELKSELREGLSEIRDKYKEMQSLGLKLPQLLF